MNGTASTCGVFSNEEQCAIDEFLKIVNDWRKNGNFNPISNKEAIKFLMARKFHVERSVSLYQQHELMRLREGVSSHIFDKIPNAQSSLKSELHTGKFTVLPQRDSSGATVAIFNSKHHNPADVSHQVTLRGVIYQLDCALESIETQRNGLIFIYNMSGSKYTNFDYDLSQKMLNLLKGAYPARLKKVLIVMAPLWFRAPFKVLRLFVREKLRDRVFTVSLPQLQFHLPLQSIPEYLGGYSKCDHESWLQKCHNISNESDKVVENGVTLSPKSRLKNCNHPTLRHLENIPIFNGKSSPLNNDEDTEDHLDTHSNMNGEDKHNNNISFGMQIEDFINHVRCKRRIGLYEEYNEIKSRQPMGSFLVANMPQNIMKNRYSDVLCYDHSRVKLDVGEFAKKQPSPKTDYINGNYIDGYKEKAAFISTQGPLPNTYDDFWQMVWQENVHVIVMTTKAVERGRVKCGQYWPELGSPDLETDQFTIKNVQQPTHFDTLVEVKRTITGASDFVILHLELINKSNGHPSRNIVHFQFISWPDYGVPESTSSMIDFVQCIRNYHNHIKQQSDDSVQQKCPIVVHCSAGIGRTGTYVTLDTAMKQYEDTQKVDIAQIVEKIRTQRAHSIQMPEQYVFCHLAFLYYVATSSSSAIREQFSIKDATDINNSQRIIERFKLTNFDEDCEDY